MDKLKWTRVSKGDCWPASGLFLVRVAVSGGVGVIVIAGVKGDVISPSSVVAIAGPIVIAEPDPELELPRGWFRIEGTDTFGVWKGSTETEYGIRLTASSADPARCVRAINAAVKALEEERSG